MTPTTDNAPEDGREVLAKHAAVGDKVALLIEDIRAAIGKHQYAGSETAYAMPGKRYLYAAHFHIQGREYTVTVIPSDLGEQG